MKAYKPLDLNKDFRRAYYRGRSFVAPAIAVYFVKNRRQECRLGLTAGKKIGCAVERNRARRVMRHAFCELLKDQEIKSSLIGYDIVIVARTKAVSVKSTVIEAQLRGIYEKAGIIK